MTQQQRSSNDRRLELMQGRQGIAYEQGESAFQYEMATIKERNRSEKEELLSLFDAALMSGEKEIQVGCLMHFSITLAAAQKKGSKASCCADNHSSE